MPVRKEDWKEDWEEGRFRSLLRFKLSEERKITRGIGKKRRVQLKFTRVQIVRTKGRLPKGSGGKGKVHLKFTEV